MSYPDFDAVDKIVHGVLASQGFVYTDKHGEERVDDERLKDAVFQLMFNEHVVSGPRQLTTGAATQHELYEKVFPTGPGARRQPQSEEESVARDRLARKLWGFTNSGTTGYCQKRAEAEGHTLIMCEAEVGRTYRSDETGKPKPTTEPGRFFTDHPDLITTHSTLPQSHKLTKAAEAVAKHMTMTVRRHPEIAATVARQTSVALKQSQTTLAPVTDAKAAAAAISASKTDDDVA